MAPLLLVFLIYVDDVVIVSVEFSPRAVLTVSAPPLDVLRYRVFESSFLRVIPVLEIVHEQSRHDARLAFRAIR